jgi:N-acyl-L-homoserine lactone synthetase
MIELFKRSDAIRLPGLFRSMHADRMRVFVDMLKWDIPHDETSEADGYDTDKADNLVLQDSDSGEHLGSVRVLPTTGSHMLADVFPFLCEGNVPRGPQIKEITRLLVSPRAPRRERIYIRNMLVRSLIDFGLQTGVDAYTCVCDYSFLTQLLAGGWKIDPLGLPQQYEGSLIGAIKIHIDETTVSRTVEAWRHPGPAQRLYQTPQSMAA